VIRPTRAALDSSGLQANYHQCWLDVKKHFNPEQR